MAPPDRLLVGWKAIGAHLGRDARTAQRWRDGRGLPVHGVSGRGGSVYARPEELDAWLRATPPAVAPEDGPEAPPPPAHHADAPAGGRSSKWWATAGALGLLGLAVLSALGLARHGHVAGMAAARVTLSEGALTALDGAGATLWRKPLDRPAVVPRAVERPALVSATLQVDLDGDGRREILVALGAPTDAAPPVDDAVAAFSPEGEELWRYTSQPAPGLEATAQGPWRLSDWVALPRRHGPAQVFVAMSRASGPSLVERIDALGRGELIFVNAGPTFALAGMNDGQAELLLAGGVDDAEAKASLAILELGAPSAIAPASALQGCVGCPTAAPRRFWLFPRSELSRLPPATPSRVEQLAGLGDRVQVGTAERGAAATDHYLLLPGLRLRHEGPGDGYWATHDREAAAGHLGHPSSACPARRGRVLRSWIEGRWADEPVAAF